MCSSRSVTPSTRCWTNWSRPVTSSTSRVLALEDTTATPQTRGRHRLEVAPRPLEDLDAVVVQELLEHVVLAVAQAVDGLGAAGVVRVALGQLDAAAGQEGPDAVLAFLAVDVVAGSRPPGRRGRTLRRCARPAGDR